VLALGPSLKLFVKSVGKVFDIQDGHSDASKIPPLWRNHRLTSRPAWRLDSRGTDDPCGIANWVDNAIMRSLCVLAAVAVGILVDDHFARERTIDVGEVARG
jgi:hypothetical protein